MLPSCSISLIFIRHIVPILFYHHHLNEVIEAWLGRSSPKDKYISPRVSMINGQIWCRQQYQYCNVFAWLIKQKWYKTWQEVISMSRLASRQPHIQGTRYSNVPYVLSSRNRPSPHTIWTVMEFLDNPKYSPLEIGE